jgi:hypothetical protein
MFAVAGVKPTPEVMLNAIGIENIVMAIPILLFIIYCFTYFRSKMITDDRFVKSNLLDQSMFPSLFIKEQLKDGNKLMVAYLIAQVLFFVIILRIFWNLFS